MQIRRSIYRFLCVSLFFGSSLSSYAQADSTIRVGGITIGIDVSRFFVQIWNPIRGNYEVSLGGDIGKKFSLNGEAGILTTNQLKFGQLKVKKICLESIVEFRN